MMNRTVLFVDDERSILKSIIRQFRNADFILLTADSARDALDILALNKVALVISDERMPGMNGMEFIKKVKNDYPDTVRIILSGYANSETIARAVETNDIYRFLLKPWSKDEMESAINDALDLYEDMQRQKPDDE